MSHLLIVGAKQMSISRYRSCIILSLILLGSGGAAAQAQSFDRYDRRVEVINQTSVPLWSFFASTARTDSWEEDILGSDILLPGRSLTVNIDDGSGYCRYDLKAVLADGREVTEFDFDVCSMASWTIYE
jgi:hypothetical protein